jgi:hypothetical protein
LANVRARDACNEPTPRIRVYRVLTVCARSHFLGTFALSE